jgi:hypothetical protein
MKPEHNSDALGIPTPSQESIEIFSTLIFDTINQVNKRFKVTHHRVPDEPFNIIHQSFLLLKLNEWKPKFTHLRTVGFRFFTTPARLWATIAHGLYSPKVGEAYKKLNPSFDPEKYLTAVSATPAPQKITPPATPTPKKKHPHKRGELWKLNPRWDHLWPSSRKTFTELCRRTQKPKNPFAFTWCQAGIPSLVKFTGVSEHQVKRSLQQLQNYSLIKRIVRGYEGSRGSKYYVFLTPKMSGAFYFATRKAKNQQPQKKRTSRIH